MVFSLGQRQAQLRFAGLRASGRPNRLGVVVQHHAGQQLADLLRVHRMLRPDLIDLGHMVPGRTHAVNKLAVVRQQQQTGRVLVQPPDRLHACRRAAAALADRRWQQRVDAGIGARLLRAFVAGGLVQHQIGFFMVLPGHALNRELQAIRYEIHSRFSARSARYRHKPLLNQPRADASRPKTLGKKDFLQLHVCFCHGAIVARRIRLPDYRPAGKRLSTKWPACRIIPELEPVATGSCTPHPPDTLPFHDD